MNRFQFYYDSSDDESSDEMKCDTSSKPVLRVDSSSRDPYFQHFTSKSPRGVEEPFNNLNHGDKNGENVSNLNPDFEIAAPSAGHLNDPDPVTDQLCVRFGVPTTYKVWFEKYIRPRLEKNGDSSISNIQFIIKDSVNDFILDGGEFRDEHGKIFDIVMTQDEKTFSRLVKESARLLTCARQTFDQIYTINKKRKMMIQEMEQLQNIPGETRSTNGMNTSTNDSKRKETKHSRTMKSTSSSSSPKSKSKSSSTTGPRNIDDLLETDMKIRNSNRKRRNETTVSKSNTKKMKIPEKNQTKGSGKQKGDVTGTRKSSDKPSVSKSSPKTKSSSTTRPRKIDDLLETDTKISVSKRKSRKETTVSKSNTKKMKIPEKDQTKGSDKQKGDVTGTRNSSDKPSVSKSSPKSKTKSFSKGMIGPLQSSSTSTQIKEQKNVPQEISVSSENASLQDNTSLVTQDDSCNAYDASLSLTSFDTRGVISKASLVSDIHVYDSAISRFVNVSNPKMYTYMVDRLNHLFKCPVCLEIMEKVYIVPICLHRICYTCAESSIRKCSHRCPECRVHVPTKRILRNDERYEYLKNQIFDEGGIAETIGRNNQVQNDSLRKSMTSHFLCSSCKDLPTKTFVVPECMHRFCSDCLDDDCDFCPECEIRITSKLPIREDSKFDELRQTLIGDGGLLD